MRVIESTKIVRMAGKKYRLPEVLYFEGEDGLQRDPCYYIVIAFRPPKKGEYYLSGAQVQVWQAPNDLSTEFLIVERTSQAEQVVMWTRLSPENAIECQCGALVPRSNWMQEDSPRRCPRCFRKNFLSESE